jgi:hypothetical protein
MAMQTRVDEMLGVKFRCMTSERTPTVLQNVFSSGTSPAVEQSRPLTGKRAGLWRAARAGRASRRDPVVAPVQSWVSSERQARLNHPAAQCGSISQRAGHSPGWVNNGGPTTARKLDFIIEFIDAGGLLGELVGQ